MTPLEIVQTAEHSRPSNTGVESCWDPPPSNVYNRVCCLHFCGWCRKRQLSLCSLLNFLSLYKRCKFIHLYYSTIVMFSLFSLSFLTLVVMFIVYSYQQLHAIIDHVPQQSACRNKTKSLLALTTTLFLSVVQGVQELNFVKIFSGRLSCTLSNWGRCVILPVNSKSRQIVGHCVIWRKEG